MGRMRYTPHEMLVGPARTSPEPWRLLAGLVVIAAIYIGLNSAGFAVTEGLMGDAAYFDFAGEVLAADTTRGTIAVLATFLPLVIGTGVALALLHGRGLSSLLGLPRAALRDFLRVLRALVILGLVLALVPGGAAGPEPTPNLAPSAWATLLPLALALILVQVGSEELLFRGYLQSQLAARFASPVVWIGLPSALFALGHYAPADMGANAWLIALWAGIFGALAGDLTARSGNLGPALAMHLMNNLGAMLIVAPEGMLSGLALYTLPIDLSDTEAMRARLPIDFAIMGLSWLAARVALRV